MTGLLRAFRRWLRNHPRCGAPSPDGERCKYKWGHDSAGQPHSWARFGFGGPHAQSASPLPTAAEVRVKELEAREASLRDALAALADAVEHQAALNAYGAELGASEWQAFLPEYLWKPLEAARASLRTLERALPASSVVPVEAGTGTDSAEDRRAPDGASKPCSERGGGCSVEWCEQEQAAWGSAYERGYADGVRLLWWGSPPLELQQLIDWQRRNDEGATVEDPAPAIRMFLNCLAGRRGGDAS